MKNTIHNILAAVLLVFVSGIFSGVKAQNYCVTGCNPNAYVNSVDPNTLEYDNMVSVFHASIAKEFDGTVKVWGEGIAANGSNITSVTTLNSSFGTGSNQLSGTILKFAAASNTLNHQFAVLTTNGLYVWGKSANVLVPAVTNVAANSFRKVSIGTLTNATIDGTTSTAVKADGLPYGVNPGDVKMMFGTYQGLAIVTCTGAAYVLTVNPAAYGDSATDNGTNDLLWHHVLTATNTPLTNVVAVRGTTSAFMALTSNGKIYTWGTGTLSNNSDGITTPTNRNFATEITKPSVGGTQVTPKMIGMTIAGSNKTYYLLDTNGNLFSMGNNTAHQLGNSSTTASNTWVTVTSSATVGGTTYTLGGNIVYISPQEHNGSGDLASINVLTDDGKLWAWGNNAAGMLAGGRNDTNDAYIDPIFMPGRTTGSYNAAKLNATDKVMAVETGGHTTLTIKQCTTKFGYVGHKINGSMANASTGFEQDYNYADTAVLSICGAISAPVVQDLKICDGATTDLANAEPTSLPTGATGINWWTDAAGTIPVSNPTAVGPGTYYATYEGLKMKCPSPMTVSYLQPGDTGYGNCACYNPAVTPGTGPDTKVGITLLQRAGNDAVGQWPMARKSGHVALESNTKGFVVTRVATTAALSNISTPKEGMMVYDGEAKCLKIYSDGAWKCFNQPACP